MAVECDMDSSLISGYENREYMPEMWSLFKICRRFDVKSIDLLGF